MRVNATQSAQAASPQAEIGEIGDNDFAIVADDHKSHGALTIDDHRQLPIELAGMLGQIARQLRRDDLSGRDPAAVDAFQRLDLAWF